MALQQIYRSNISKGYQLVLTVTETSYSQANNTSNISYSLAITNTTNTYAQYETVIKVWIGGWVYNNSYQTSVPNQNSSVTLCSGTTVITHDADGTKRLECLAIVDYTYVEIYIPDKLIVGTSESTGYFMELTPLLKPSLTIGNISNLNVGQSTTVTYLPNKANTFYFTLGYQYTLPNGTKSAWVHPNGTTAIKSDSTTFTWPTTLGSHYPNTTNIPMRIWVGVYTTASTQISGHSSEAYKSITVKIPESYKPNISTSITETNTAVSKLGNIIVGGYSKLKVTVTSTPKLGSTITANSITAFNNTYNTTTKTINVPNIPEVSQFYSIITSATDSRGYVSQSTNSRRVYRYLPPKANKLKTSIKQGKLYVSFTSSVWMLSGLNSAQGTIRYQPDGGTAQTINIPSLGYTEDVSKQLNYDISKPGTITVTTTDLLSNTTQTIRYIPNSYTCTFDSSQLNDTIPSLTGVTITIPTTQYYKSIPVNIYMKDSPVSILNHTNIVKHYVHSWVDATGAMYTPGTTYTLTGNIVLTPVFQSTGPSYNINITPITQQRRKYYGYSLTDVSTPQHGPTQLTIQNIKQTTTVYLYTGIPITFNAGDGSIVNTIDTSYTPSQTYVMYKKAWETLTMPTIDQLYAQPKIKYDGNTSGGITTKKFVGWTPTLPQTITDNTFATNLVFTANYDVDKFTVRFYDVPGGNLLKEILNVPFGSSVTPPQNPTMQGKTFRGWSAEFNNIQSDRTIYGIWDNSSIWIMSKHGLWVPYLPEEK